MSKDEYNANGKKMTDEEKRKNFLERNRLVVFTISKHNANVLVGLLL
jgi:ATF/CREB family transcription factor